MFGSILYESVYNYIKGHKYLDKIDVLSCNLTHKSAQVSIKLNVISETTTNPTSQRFFFEIVLHGFSDVPNY